jgi:hypothetical protein
MTQLAERAPGADDFAGGSACAFAKWLTVLKLAGSTIGAAAELP